MQVARGLAIAFGIFTAAFALHVVAGRLNQDWLFTIAVALIYLAATGFGVIAFATSGGGPGSRTTLVAGSIAGVVLTISALWAANDRAFAWWQFPLAPALVALTSVVLAGGWAALRRTRRRPPRHAAAQGG